MEQTNDSPISNDSEALLSPARLGAVLGIAGLCLNMTACCTGLFGLGAGLLLGASGLLMGYSVHSQRPEGEARAFAQVGMITGSLAAAWSVVAGLIVFVYILGFFFISVLV